MSFFISLINPDTISQAFFPNNAFSFTLFKFYFNTYYKFILESVYFQFMFIDSMRKAKTLNFCSQEPCCALNS